MKASLPPMDSGPPVSARDASYWLNLASIPSSSRSGVVSSSSTRSLDASSFLLSLRSSSGSFLDSNKSLLTPTLVSNETEGESVPPPPSSLYDSNLFVPMRLGASKPRPKQKPSKRESKRPVIIAEEVYEHQRYQMVLGWGSKGHLLPLDPDKYMRVEEEERFERLRALVAAQPQSFLEIPPSHQSPSDWKPAISLFDSMDNYSLPSEKAAVLVEVARCIYETHAREHGFTIDSASSSSHQKQPTPMAADDFLPIFIFVLARCSLRSVVVARHLISETMITALMIGETGYYATMLEAAIGYIAAFEGVAKTDEVVNRNSGSGSTAFSSF
ncbi:hypothetical protein PHMEG_00013413 [Phytophthora megakarya]|uniref:VPS9 domain-containing protein n=1 Tax=Phytophthora megakarya TaxID=4795 RepID=A0A225W6B5_9STRA|nr:hypothetical protein PHMEG_00013413 [Phytophthora megakarya]